ncbi:MAG TPA: histidine kinase [Solirubrobacteraceae bacterium]|nr:histidine kinase [Solirubrobacteraceae bacterium]
MTTAPEARLPSAARHWLLDGAIALAAFGATVGLLSHGLGSSGNVTHHLDALGMLLAAASSFPLLVWRRAPLAVFVLTTAASAASMARGYPGGPPVGPTVALYLLAASRDVSCPWTRQTTEVVVVMFCVHVLAFGLGHDQVPEVQIAFGAVVWGLAWFAGERTRLRRQQLSELEERARRAEQEAVRERRLAVAEERARIARDLHDSAAHAINVIAVQAGAARLWQEQDPGRSRAALETIEDVAHRTVAEIDQIVHSLRDEHTASTSRVEPSPGLAAFDSLIAQHSSAGLPVTFATRGEPRPLGGAVDRAAYRILQEALTNCARHGAGDASVELAFGVHALELTVANAVRPDAPVRASLNGGHGLVGMCERAALLGGELEAGRRNGAFRVHARLPYGEAA